MRYFPQKQKTLFYFNKTILHEGKANWYMPNSLLHVNRGFYSFPASACALPVRWWTSILMTAVFWSMGAGMSFGSS